MTLALLIIVIISDDCEIKKKFCVNSNTKNLLLFILLLVLTRLRNVCCTLHRSHTFSQITIYIIIHHHNYVALVNHIVYRCSSTLMDMRYSDGHESVYIYTYTYILINLNLRSDTGNVVGRRLYIRI